MSEDSLKFKFPLPWQGLHTALVSHSNQLQKMEMWLQKLRHCRHRNEASWEDLVTCLICEEPLNSQDKLTGPLIFEPLLYHLPSVSQNLLLAFLHQHRDEVPRRSLRALVSVLSTSHMTTVQENTKNTGTEAEYKIPPYCCDEKPDEPSLMEMKIENQWTKSLPKSDWLDFWKRKLCKFLGEVHSDEFGEGKSTDANDAEIADDASCTYSFTTDTRGQVRQILSRLSDHHEDTLQRHPWNTQLWTDGGETQVSTVRSSLSGQEEVAMDTCVSSQSLSQGAHVTDSELSQSLGGSASKRIKSDDSVLECGLSESRLEAALGEHLLSCGQRMREAWHRTSADDVTSDDLTSLSDCTLNELETLTQYVDLSNLPEQNLAVVAAQVTTQRERLPRAHTETLAKACLLQKVRSLSGSGSRALYQACVSLTQAYPHGVIKSVLVPVLADPGVALHQTDLIVKLVKDMLSPHSRDDLLRGYLSSGTTLMTATIPVLQTIVDTKTPLEPATLDLFVSLLSRSSSLLAENLKFGKLLLGLAKVYDDQLSSAQVTSLLQVTDSHKTFLKKSISMALGKIKV